MKMSKIARYMVKEAGWGKMIGYPLAALGLGGLAFGVPYAASPGFRRAVDKVKDFGMGVGGKAQGAYNTVAGGVRSGIDTVKGFGSAAMGEKPLEQPETFDTSRPYTEYLNFPVTPQQQQIAKRYSPQETMRRWGTSL